MKISEAIKELQYYLEREGDLDIKLNARDEFRFGDLEKIYPYEDGILIMQD